MNGQGPRPDSPRGAVNSKGGGVEAGVRTAILLKEYSCGGKKKLLLSESANASPPPPTNVCQGSRGGSRPGRATDRGLRAVRIRRGPKLD